MKNYIFCFILLALYSCANIVPLSGGGLDDLAPRIVSSNPNNKSINFNEKSIVIEFDEYITFGNIHNIRLSPSCVKTPEFLISGKKIHINLECELQKNTTYSINFGKEIKDLNEGNYLNGFNFIFSTGSSIDSLKIQGNAKHLYSGLASRGALIGLYKLFEDTDSIAPYYYTFSNDSGDFLIENIAEGNYVIFGIIDEDNNLLYSDGELITTPIPIGISHFNEDNQLGFFKPVNNIKLISVNNPYKNSVEFDYLETSAIQVLNTTGHWNKNIFWALDTVDYIKYQINNEIDSIQLYNQTEFKLDLKIESTISDIYKHKKINISSNKPIIDIDSNSILNISLLSPFEIEVLLDLELENEVNLLINKGTLTSFDGEVNDSINFQFNFNEQLFGSLIIQKNKYKNCFIELFQKDQIIYTALVSDSTTIDWINPGVYQLRVFNDENNNGVWDRGSWNLNEFSEDIYIYPETIKIRPNWEVDLILN